MSYTSLWFVIWWPNGYSNIPEVERFSGDNGEEDAKKRASAIALTGHSAFVVQAKQQYVPSHEVVQL